MKENRLARIEYNIEKIREEIAAACARSGRSIDEVKIMAVTKTVPYEEVNFAVSKGITLLGENRAQEMLSKYEMYSSEAEIHFIGALQSNKVRYVIDKVKMIQSVDSVKLAAEISKRAQICGIEMEALVEINIGEEESKSGIELAKAEEMICEIAEMKGIKVRGLMTIPPICEKTAESGKFFENMRRLFVDIKGKKIDNVSMDILSMGMSGDYVEAIEHGTNIVRLGRAMFGERKYV